MKDLIAAVRMIEAAWPQSFTEQQAAVYLDGLADMPSDAVQAAVRRLVRSEEYRPTVARIRREIERQGLPERDEALLQAAAWMRWKDARKYDNGTRPSVSEPKVHVAVRQICMTLSGTTAWTERFLKAWGRLIDG